jgi:soluble lytic murein transglycosylase-like protein
LLALLCAGAAADAAAETGPEVTEAVAEASALFGVPAPWIEAVIAVESGGSPQAVSSAGAMGLMQLMPATWRDLRRRLGLGPDPFDVRDNVLAGTAYLRDMLDRFGAPGFLAAYNAGPGRYAAHLAGRAALPRETRAYVDRLGPLTDGAAAPNWRASALFPAGRAALFAPQDGSDEGEAPAGASIPE